MSYSFAYNNGSSPSGTTKFAKLQIGGNNREYTTYESLNWYASAPYNGKFLIVSDTYSQGWTTEGNATPTFWRSADNTLDSLKDLVNQLPDVNGVTGFTTPETAINYINSTNKYLISQESDSYNEDDIVLSGLVLNLDAGYSNSYPKSGTTWYDIKNEYNGTLINGPTFSGGSIVFDGADDYVDTSLNTDNLSSISTFNIWFRIKSNTRASLVSGYNNSNPSTNRWDIQYNRSNGQTVRFIFHQDKGTSNEGARSNQLTLNQWYNACFVINTVSGTSSVYINGIFVRSSSILRSLNTNRVLQISRGDGNTSINGDIPIVQIYNRALTSTEILQNYNATKGRFGL